MFHAAASLAIFTIAFSTLSVQRSSAEKSFWESFSTGIDLDTAANDEQHYKDHGRYNHRDRHYHDGWLHTNDWDLNRRPSNQGTYGWEGDKLGWDKKTADSSRVEQTPKRDKWRNVYHKAASGANARYQDEGTDSSKDGHHHQKKRKPQQPPWAPTRSVNKKEALPLEHHNDEDEEEEHPQEEDGHEEDSRRHRQRTARPRQPARVRAPVRYDKDHPDPEEDRDHSPSWQHSNRNKKDEAWQPSYHPPPPRAPLARNQNNQQNFRPRGQQPKAKPTYRPVHDMTSQPAYQPEPPAILPEHKSHKPHKGQKHKKPYPQPSSASNWQHVPEEPKVIPLRQVTKSPSNKQVQSRRKAKKRRHNERRARKRTRDRHYEETHIRPPQDYYHQPIY